MEDIRTFRNGDLQSVKKVLRESFFAEGKDEVYNEWEMAERVISDDGFRKQLCLVASEGEEIIGYCLLTDARIEDEEGLALGPVAVREDFRGRGVGTRLIETGLGRAREAGFPWVAVLGGEFYHRFGFEYPRENFGFVIRFTTKRGSYCKARKWFRSEPLFLS